MFRIFYVYMVIAPYANFFRNRNLPCNTFPRDVEGLTMRVIEDA